MFQFHIYEYDSISRWHNIHTTTNIAKLFLCSILELKNKEFLQILKLFIKDNRG